MGLLSFFLSSFIGAEDSTHAGAEERGRGEAGQGAGPKARPCRQGASKIISKGEGGRKEEKGGEERQKKGEERRGEERRGEKRRGEEGVACHWDNSGQQALDGPQVFSRVSGWLGRVSEYQIA